MDIERVEPRSTGEPQSSGSPISRRTVVAVGVAAAWTIPLIQLATATPAAAASGLTLTFDTPPPRGQYARITDAGVTNVLVLNISGGVKNADKVGTNTNPPTSNVSLIIVLPIAVSTTTPQISTSPAGWGTGAVSQDASSYTLTYTTAIARGATLSFTGIQLKNITPPLPDTTGVAFTLTFTARDDKPTISTVTTTHPVKKE